MLCVDKYFELESKHDRVINPIQTISFELSDSSAYSSLPKNNRSEGIDMKKIGKLNLENSQYDTISQLYSEYYNYYKNQKIIDRLKYTSSVIRTWSIAPGTGYMYKNTSYCVNFRNDKSFEIIEIYDNKGNLCQRPAVIRTSEFFNYFIDKMIKFRKFISFIDVYYETDDNSYNKSGIPIYNYVNPNNSLDDLDTDSKKYASSYHSTFGLKCNENFPNKIAYLYKDGITTREHIIHKYDTFPKRRNDIKYLNIAKLYMDKCYLLKKSIEKYKSSKFAKYGNIAALYKHGIDSRIRIIKQYDNLSDIKKFQTKINRQNNMGGFELVKKIDDMEIYYCAKECSITDKIYGVYKFITGMFGNNSTSEYAIVEDTNNYVHVNQFNNICVCKKGRIMKNPLVYKFAKTITGENCIIYLVLLTDSKVAGSSNDGKLRTNRCFVQAIYPYTINDNTIRIHNDVNMDTAISNHRSNFVYYKNEIVIEENFNPDMSQVCVDGIHFFTNVEFCLEYVHGSLVKNKKIIYSI